MRTNSPSKAKRRRVRFEYLASPGSQVFLAGDFNQWNPKAKMLEDKQQDGTFTGAMILEPGIYEYKFVVDGIWCVDPHCPEWTQNAVGSLNSVLHVE